MTSRHMGISRHGMACCGGMRFWGQGCDLPPALSLSCSQRLPFMFSITTLTPLRQGRKLSSPLRCLGVDTGMGGC